MKNKRWTYDCIIKPGKTWSGEALSQLSLELNRVAATCFDTVPEYQCLTGKPKDLSDKVLMVVRDGDGVMRGFISSVIIDVPMVGEVLHSGLVCIDPQVRKSGLAHKLLYRLVFNYLIKYKRSFSTWFTNVSSLIGVCSTFSSTLKDVYPSPVCRVPSNTHIQISQHYSEQCRSAFHISGDIRFDSTKFIFREGNRKTAFLKRAKEGNTQYKRDDVHNRYYDLHMDADKGDAVLQVGKLSAFLVLAEGAKFLCSRIRRG